MAKATYSEAVKEIRATAKKAGLTFKRQNATINGKQAYKFVCRESGITKMENCTLWIAYENCLSGYIESYNQEKGVFDGVGCY